MAAVGTGLVITIYPVLDTEAVEAAVDILKKDKRIKRSIGKYQSLGIHHLDSASLKKNQEEVKVTLTGNKGSLFVHCLMQLTIEGEWAMKEILGEEKRLPPPTT